MNLRDRWTASRDQFVLFAVFAATKLLLALSTGPEVFPDSGSYRLSGWKNTVRPYGLSFIFDVLNHHPGPIVVVQTLVSAVCWFWMFRELWLVLRPAHPTLAIVVTVFLAIASLSGPALMWDRMVLSETFAISVMVASIAISLRMVRLQFARRQVIVGIVVLMVSGFIRETVFFAFCAPLALFLAVIAPTRPRIRGVRGTGSRGATVVAVLVLCALLVPLVSHPGGVVFGPDGQTLNNFRTMNVIGQRSLTDPFVRTRLERAGMPKTTTPLQAAHYAMDEDWLLYKTPGMLKFANDFPWTRYLMIQLSRPTTFVKQSLPSLDRIVSTHGLDNYHTPAQEIIPQALAAWLWSWTAHLHLFVLLLGIGALIVTRRRMDSALRLVTTGSVAVATLATIGAVAAAFFDAMEVNRHALPFLLIARISLVVGVIALSGSVLASRPFGSLALDRA